MEYEKKKNIIQPPNSQRCCSLHYLAASNVLVQQVAKSNSKVGYNEQVLQCNSENSRNEGKRFGTEGGHHLKSGTSAAIVDTSTETTVKPVKIQY